MRVEPGDTEAGALLEIVSVGCPTKLPAWRKTAESRTQSEASAMTSLMWWLTFGVNVAIAVKTVVKPSNWVAKGVGVPRSEGSLLR